MSRFILWKKLPKDDLSLPLAERITRYIFDFYVPIENSGQNIVLARILENAVGGTLGDFYTRELPSSLDDYSIADLAIQYKCVRGDTISSPELTDERIYFPMFPINDVVLEEETIQAITFYKE